MIGLMVPRDRSWGCLDNLRSELCESLGSEFSMLIGPQELYELERISSSTMLMVRLAIRPHRNTQEGIRRVQLLRSSHRG